MSDAGAPNSVTSASSTSTSGLRPLPWMDSPDGREVAGIGEPEAAVLRELHEFLHARRGRACVRRRDPRACCRRALRQISPRLPTVPVVDQDLDREIDGAVARPRRNRFPIGRGGSESCFVRILVAIVGILVAVFLPSLFASRPPFIASVPDLTKSRAAAMPLSSGPSAVWRTSMMSDFAPARDRSATCFFSCSTTPSRKLAIRMYPDLRRRALVR